jgi:hypothetical protein
MILADFNDDIITLPQQPAKEVTKINDKCYHSENRTIEAEKIENIDE